jgi:hypothetical protein
MDMPCAVSDWSSSVMCCLYRFSMRLMKLIKSSLDVHEHVAIDGVPTDLMRAARE